MPLNYSWNASQLFLECLSTTTYSKRLARWIEEFQEYNLTIKYRKGAEAIVPDAISRRPDFIQDGPANIAAGRVGGTTLHMQEFINS
ncbi:hypothetical protein N7486_011121 [Penicillium sp. IBT 16267x]|nr:hypothetical protein N7486_011121 [Penicillium sp. IBT 16267x]